MPRIRTILVTTDLSPTSESAFEPARELALRLGAKVVLAHVDQPQTPFVAIESYAAVLDNSDLDRRLQAGDRLARYAAEHFVPHVNVKLELLSGIPHMEIVRLAGSCNADLIVMATHGRGFFSHAILGSTTERVLRRAPCPVFVVRAEPERARAAS